MPCPLCGRVMCDCNPNERGQSHSEIMAEYARDFEKDEKTKESLLKEEAEILAGPPPSFHMPRRKPNWSDSWYLHILETCVEDEQGLLWLKKGLESLTDASSYLRL